MRLIHWTSLIVVLGLAATLGCKPRQEGEQGSTVLAEGDAASSGSVTKLDAIDVSFFMPQVTPQNRAAGLAISVKEPGGCGDDVPASQCGPILSKGYFKQIVEKVPRYKDTKDMFTDFRGDSLGRSVDQAYDNLFISAFRYDPCAPAAHKVKDGPNNFSSDDQCEAELRFVVQHWDESGKPADQGLHVGTNLTHDESKKLLAELVALKQFATANGVKTNGVPIGVHPGFNNPKIAKEFFARVRKISRDFSGTAITKGVATFITLARPGGGVRWQWALTAQPQKKQVGSDKEKFVFGPLVVSVGAPNIQTGKPGALGPFTAPSSGIEVFRDEAGNRISDVVPPSLTANPLTHIANTVLSQM